MPHDWPNRPQHWDPDDWLAFEVARSIRTGTAPCRTSTHRSALNVTSILHEQGLLGLTDPASPALPLDSEQRALFAQGRTALALRSLHRVKAAMAARDALQSAGIRALFIKGPVLSTVVWGRADARGLGDIDVVVEEADLTQAVQALVEIGARIPSSIADLRPRPRDRRMHHALSLYYAGTNLDIHYRLDAFPTVLSMPFEELWSRSRLIHVNGTVFRTIDDELTLLLIAANGGRDGWIRWGRVLDFAELHDRVRPDPALVEAMGLTTRIAVGTTLAGLLDGAVPSTSRRVRRLARQCVAMHAEGSGGTLWAQRAKTWRLDLWRLRAGPRSIGAGWVMAQFVWPGDAPGRPVDSGLREDLRGTLLKALGAKTQPALEPDSWLCNLADRIDDADSGRPWPLLDPQVEDQLALIAFAASRLPNHDFGRMVSDADSVSDVLTRSREATIRLVDDLRQRCPQALLFGDLAAANSFHAGTWGRLVRSSMLVEPDITESTALALAREVAQSTGATVREQRYPTLELDGGQVSIRPTQHPGLSVGRYLRRLDQSPEMVFFDSLFRSTMGRPPIMWYLDALAAGPSLDWDRVWSIARAAGWVEPVARAAAVMFARGQQVPLRLSSDSLADAVYWGSPAPPAVRTVLEQWRRAVYR